MPYTYFIHYLRMLSVQPHYMKINYRILIPPWLPELVPYRQAEPGRAGESCLELWISGL